MAPPLAFPYAKPVFGGAIAFLTGLSAALADGVVSGQEWVTVALGTVVALGAVFGVTGTELVNPPATAFEIDQSDPDEPGEHRAE